MTTTSQDGASSDTTTSKTETTSKQDDASSDTTMSKTETTTGKEDDTGRDLKASKAKKTSKP